MEDALSLSRTTTATYSLYLWNTITFDDSDPIEEWSAEFHSGSLHRVETPRDRVVADCSAMTGTALNLVTGERMTGAQIAKAACGVNANIAVLSSRHVGETQTRFGAAQRIEIIDEHQVRGYSVLANGALVEATISERGPPVRLRLSACAVQAAATLPELDMFSVGSLGRSAVPLEYRQKGEC